MGKVAVVTGANKGIGLAIVRALCKQFDGDVFLTARDEGRGQEAIKQLESEGMHPKFYQLDITNLPSVMQLTEFIKGRYGGIDVLVNNAGIAFKMASEVPFADQVLQTMETNFWGTKQVCDAMWPLLRHHSRVVNMSSTISVRRALDGASEEVRARLTAKDLTTKDVMALMDEFVSLTSRDEHRAKGWAHTGYSNVLVGISALTRVQQRDLARLQPEKDIIVNAACPGFVGTDMSSFKGPLTPDQGAVVPVQLCLLPWDVESPRGQLVSEDGPFPWQ